MHVSSASTRLAIVTLAAAILASCNPVPVRRAATPIPELAGRTAGPPQRCVATRQAEAPRLGGDRVILYGGGRTLWVNRLSEGCVGINRNDILVVEPAPGSYCRGDRVRSVDPLSGLPGPGCILGDFVPFRR